MIREATTADIAYMVALERSVESENSIWGYVADSEENWENRDLAWTLVYVVEEQIAGFIHCSPRPYSGECVFPAGSKILEIVDLAVAMPYRRRRIGYELVAAIRQRAIDSGFTHLRVYSAAKRFDDILTFYRECGFKPWYLEMIRPIRVEEDDALGP